MFSIAKRCSKRVSMLNFVVQTLFAHESSVRSSFFSVCTLTQLRSIAMNNARFKLHQDLELLCIRAIMVLLD